MEPITTALLIYKGLNIANTFMAGNAYRHRLKRQRNLNDLKGITDWNMIWESVLNDLNENFAVFSASGAIADPSAGSFEAIQKEVLRKGEQDLDWVNIMTASMEDEMNYRIGESRRADKFSIAMDIADMAAINYQGNLNKQHKDIKASYDEVQRKKVYFPYNFRTGKFTASRDLFTNMNVKGSWKKIQIPKYKMDFHFGTTPIFERRTGYY
jgi:hypothetical protein